VPEAEIFFWTFMVQGKVTEADTPTIWLGVTPSGLISNPPPSSPHVYAGCASCHNPPTLSDFGQAAFVLAYIPSGASRTKTAELIEMPFGTQVG